VGSGELGSSAPPDTIFTLSPRSPRTTSKAGSHSQLYSMGRAAMHLPRRTYLHSLARLPFASSDTRATAALRTFALVSFLAMSASTVPPEFFRA
jgi:hypothetical protein